MWQALPADVSLRRENPSSFIGPFSEQDQCSDERHLRSGYRWLNRYLGVNADVISLIYSESICAMAQQLTGGNLRQAVVNGLPMGSYGTARPGGPTDPALGNEGAREFTVRCLTATKHQGLMAATPTATHFNWA